MTPWTDDPPRTTPSRSARSTAAQGDESTPPRRSARVQVSGRFLIFAFVLIGVGMSILAVIFTLPEQKDAGAAHRNLQLGQMFHRAHLMGPRSCFLSRSFRPARPDRTRCPGRKIPRRLDFAYFAFVIGATAQTSDIDITSSGMRRLALLHAALSFLFNTFILALGINVLASLL